MTEYADIKDSIRLEEVIDNLGIYVDRVDKGEYWSSCPLSTHPGSDASPSFSVNDELLVYNCFVCGGGPLPKLVQDVLSLDSWDDAIDWLTPYSDGPSDTDEGFMKQLARYLERADQKPHYERTPELPYYSESILERMEDAPLELVAKWGIKDTETILHHKIKYDPEHARVFKKGEYVGPALIIPHFFGGKMVGYQERWLDDDRPDGIPKYTNSDDFPRKETLYGWDEAKMVGATPLIVVESTMTRVRLWELDYLAVATFGASLSERQIRLLRNWLPGLIFAQDNDPDFKNAKGQMVAGAGKANLAKNVNALLDYTSVEVIPPATKEKGDLADLEDEEIVSLIEARKAVFQPLANPKGRRS